MLWGLCIEWLVISFLNNKKMVGKLEAELEDYEEISGRHFPAEKPANFQVRVLVLCTYVMHVICAFRRGH